MDWLSFFSNVIASIAWPVTSFAIVLLLRKQFIALLPSLRKFKAGPVEAEFEREVKELKEEIAITQPLPDPALLEEKSQRNLKLAALSPRAAILEAWQGVDFAARRAIIQHAGSPIPDVSSPLRVVKALAKSGLVSVDDVTLFNDLRGLRNQATHSPDFNPSYESAANYLQLAGSLQSRLEQLAGIEG